VTFSLVNKLIFGRKSGLHLHLEALSGYDAPISLTKQAFSGKVHFFDRAVVELVKFTLKRYNNVRFTLLRINFLQFLL